MKEEPMLLVASNLCPGHGVVVVTAMVTTLNSTTIAGTRRISLFGLVETSGYGA